MSVDWLTDLERSINSGNDCFACPGVQTGEFVLATRVDELRSRAERTAKVRKFPINIYRLINPSDVVSGDSFLVVRKFIESGSMGEVKVHWSIVDTQEAAEMLRDVSRGPSPYFGAVVECTVDPNK